MKIIAQVLVYNEADYLKAAVEPWTSVCERIDILEGGFQTTINLGYPKRSTDGTIEIAQNLQSVYNNVTLKHHNYWNEPILRNDHLFWTVRDHGREETVLFILDGDEVYSSEEVKACVEQVNAEKDIYNTFWVNMKNYVGLNGKYHLGFRVPRFFPLKNALGFKGYNDIEFTDGIKPTDIRNVLPSHYSWTPMEKAKRKIAWQNNIGWMCSWKEENGDLVLNDEYYAATNKTKPKLLQ